MVRVALATKFDVHLRRHNASHRDAARHLHLPGPEIEGALAGADARKIENGADIGGLQGANDAFRTADGNLDFKRCVGCHHQVGRGMAEINWRIDDGLDHRITTDHPPKTNGDEQGEDL